MKSEQRGCDEKSSLMRTETYRIVRNGMNWAINHDGVLEGDYATKEAAFESAAAAASNAMANAARLVEKAASEPPNPTTLISSFMVCPWLKNCTVRSHR